MTILGEHDKTPQHRLDLIAEINKPGTIPIRLATPLPDRDQRELARALDAIRSLRSRQTGVHLAVEELLMRWLGEATGQTRSQIIQRLALELDATLPPEA